MASNRLIAQRVARRASRAVAVYSTTAQVLAKILLGIDVSELSRGTYPGTNIPQRKVAPNAKLTLTLYPTYGFVEDDDGGWIADKFGPKIGLRAARRCVEQLERAGRIAARNIGKRTLPRLRRHRAAGSCGVISAYRPNLSAAMNQERHGELMADLRAAGYCPHPFEGQWDDMATGVTYNENSLLVPNIDFRTLHELGRKYEQDAILFKGTSGSLGLYLVD